MTAQWYEVLSDYFNVNLDDAERDRWFNEIQARFHSITNDRICAVIRWASDDRNYRRDSHAGRPTVNEVMRWLAVYSAKMRDADNSKMVCSMCGGSGWVPFARELMGRDDWTLKDYNMAFTTVIPCACSVGRAMFHNNYGAGNKKGQKPIDEQKQMSIARIAVKQRQRYDQLRDEAEQALPTEQPATEQPEDDNLPF